MAEMALTSKIDHFSQALREALRRIPIVFWRGLIVVLTLIWVCHSLARLTWMLIPAPSVDQPAVIARHHITDTSVPAYSVDLAQLQSVQLFGDGVTGALLDEPVVAPQVEVEDDVEKTKLNLKLVGVFASSNQSASSAVIASGSDQKIYQIDEKLPVGNNVNLAKVLNDRVILSNNGNYEALWLYSESDFKVSYARNSRAPQREPEPEPKDVPSAVKLKPSQVPKNISDVVRFSVHREEGQMVGFRIRPNKNRELFDQLGLKANDIVTSVNGIPIDSPQAIRDNYQQVKKATSVDLEIRRGEETFYINVSLDSDV